MSYFGSAKVTLDSKGRMAIPTKFRDAILADCGGQMVMTLGKKDFALLLPMPAWKALDRKLEELPSSHPTRNRITKNAEFLEMDSGGRILVPAPMRERGLFPGANVAFAGNRTHFEVWDWDAMMKNEEEEKVAAEAGYDTLVF